MKDSLGDRMKDSYENRTKYLLPRRTYTIIRLDGKAFHTYTRGLDRPYDQKLMDDMTVTAEFLCSEIAGARFAYTQSDEISVLLTDFAGPKTQAWSTVEVTDVVYTDKRTGATTVAADVERRVWATGAPPEFTKDRAFLDAQIGVRT